MFLRGLATLTLAVLLVPAAIFAFDPAKTPATPVPPERYPNGGLRPVAILGDTTYFNIDNYEPSVQPFYFDLAAETDASGTDWLFAATGRGLEIWNISDPDLPKLTSFAYGVFKLPFWGFSDTNFFLKALDVAPGETDLVAMSANDLGMVIWQTSNKANANVHYQDQGTVDIRDVWAMRSTNGINFALAADAGSSGGLKVYNLDQAALFNSCLEDSVQSPGCSLVYRGRIGAEHRVTNIHGVANGNRRYVAIRWQVGASSNVEIWDVSNPLNTVIPGTQPKLAGSFPSPGFTHQLAMWADGSQYYLAGLKNDEVQIFNVTCITGVGTCSLPAPTATVSVPPEPGTDQAELSFGQGGGTPFLYVGSNSRGFTCVPQREYLLDVSTPSNPTDVTPEPIFDAAHVDGPFLGYWGWYNEPCSTGFNSIMPRRMTFHPDPNETIAYRAAFSLLDSHEVTGAGSPQPPNAAFSYSPLTIYEGQLVSFSDDSTGSPVADQWSWTFEDGAPATSTLQNPGSTFSLDDTGAGSESKTVTLIATNSAGSSPMTSQELVVLNPRPVVASVTSNVSSAFECSQVSFTANGVNGNPSPALGWQVDTVPAGAPVAVGGNTNPYTWVIDPGTQGTFRATVTATNASGMTTQTSGNVSVSSLPPLAFSGSGAPVIVSNAGGTAEFAISSNGATEWNWSFGDGTSTGWIANPITGPQPTHTYTSTDTYTVSVQIRNCNEGPITSGTTNIFVEVEALNILSFGANCVGIACFLNSGQSVSLLHSIQGAPDTYEYDWDGDGIFEDFRATPAPVHAYCTSGNPAPVLRIRRGNEPPVERGNSRLFAVSGTQACNPPTAPSNLVATAAGAVIQLAWNDNTGGETEYRVLRSTNGTVFHAHATLPANSTAFSDSAVVEAVTYSYRVQAYSAPNGGAFAGPSAWSNTSSASVTDPPIFADGFESGDTGAWRLTGPEGK